MSFELFALTVSFAFAVGLTAWMMLLSLRDVQEEAEEQFEVYSPSPFFKMCLPFIQYVGRRLEPFRGLEGFRAPMRMKLMYAGKSLAITVDEFFGLMTVWGIVGVLVAIYFNLTVGLGGPFAIALVLMITFIPVLQLNEKIQARQKAIRKILPYALDLLCLAVEAGLDFTAALGRIGENLGNNPLREEFRLLTRDLSMGKTRPEALRDMEHRIGLEELTAVISALVQADELGSALGPALRIQSEELQRKRFQRAEKKAMQAPVLMLIPLVLFIFPLVFMIIFAPIGLKIYGQF